MNYKLHHGEVLTVRMWNASTTRTIILIIRPNKPFYSHWRSNLRLANRLKLNASYSLNTQFLFTISTIKRRRFHSLITLARKICKISTCFLQAFRVFVKKSSKNKKFLQFFDIKSHWKYSNDEQHTFYYICHAIFIDRVPEQHPMSTYSSMKIIAPRFNKEIWASFHQKAEIFLQYVLFRAHKTWESELNLCSRAVQCLDSWHSNFLQIKRFSEAFFLKKNV